MSSTQQLLLGEGAGGGIPNYIEDVFSTYLYTGNSSTQTITNNIDLSTKGGLVWFKNRTAGSTGHMWYDTVRGAYKAIQSDTTQSEQNYSPDGLSAFTTSGFSVNGSSDYWNLSGNKFVSWTFRKQPKFFDVVTFTGTGSVQTIAHNLGSVPGCIMVKKTSSAGAWYVYHRGLVPPAATAGSSAPENYVVLNTSGQVQTLSTIWNNTDPTSTVFTVGSSAEVNASGATFVAYIFAHNAGGFGLAGTDNVITCGNYKGLGSGTGPVINLGFEPQWLLVKGVKDTSGTPDWYIVDNMRGWDADGNKKDLSPNTSAAETDSGAIKLNSTGFQPMGGDGSAFNGNQVGYIYIAIRRGPMKVPTVGTSVYDPEAYTGSGSAQTLTTGFPVDTNISKRRTASSPVQVTDRLRGSYTTYYNYLRTNSTDVETAGGTYGFGLDNNTGYVDNLFSTLNSGSTIIGWNFRRAPSFFDVVCYTGNDVAGRNITHNLTAAPELMIVKARNVTFGGGRDWNVYAAPLNNVNAGLFLNLANPASGSGGPWNGTVPTSSVFTVSANPDVNYGAWTYVAYLFATCAGVSKVGSYTGNATLTTINCGFTGGARWVLIKRTDDAASWYVWDTARGMVSGTDPSLQVNFTSGEVNADSIYTVSTGFQVVASPAVDVNTSGGTYIFLAIA